MTMETSIPRTSLSSLAVPHTWCVTARQLGGFFSTNFWRTERAFRSVIQPWDSTKQIWWMDGNSPLHCNYCYFEAAPFNSIFTHSNPWWYGTKIKSNPILNQGVWVGTCHIWGLEYEPIVSIIYGCVVFVMLSGVTSNLEHVRTHHLTWPIWPLEQ